MPDNHGHAAWVYTSSYGGGIVGGDALHLDIEVGAEALLSFDAEQIALAEDAGLPVLTLKP